MTTATTEPYRAMSCYSLTGGLLAVPGRREARALTDCCPRLSCMRPVQPAAVLDEVRLDRVTGRIAAYRCPACDAAWLCWWAPARTGARS